VIVNPCSTPARVFSYHSIRPARWYSTLVPCARGTVAAAGFMSRDRPHARVRHFQTHSPAGFRTGAITSTPS
jgi:hypothetical protein